MAECLRGAVGLSYPSNRLLLKFYYITSKSLIMKWVKSKIEIDKYLDALPKETDLATRKRIEGHFYSSDAHPIILDEYATYLDTDKFHKWGYEVELPPLFDPKLTPLHNYEIYAGGWIDFWDTEVRQNSTDHALVFKIRNCDGKRYMDAYIKQLKKFDKSNVYLNVANPPRSTDPPPPPPGRGW
jgi:hypothetical protein